MLKPCGGGAYRRALSRVQFLVTQQELPLDVRVMGSRPRVAPVSTCADLPGLRAGNKVHPVPAKKPPAGPDALGQTPLKAASPRKESKSEKQTAEPTLVKQFSSKTNDIEAATPSMVSVATDVLPGSTSCPLSAL